MDSILLTIKKMLGLSEEIEDFDLDILVHINSAFAILRQLGVGPDTPFIVKDKETVWEDFLGEEEESYQDARLYIFYKTKLGFDPYSVSSVNSHAQEMITELEWRLRIKAELEENEEVKE